MEITIENCSITGRTWEAEETPRGGVVPRVVAERSWLYLSCPSSSYSLEDFWNEAHQLKVALYRIAQE